MADEHELEGLRAQNEELRVQAERATERAAAARKVVEALERENERLERERDEARVEVARIASTRLWRLGSRYWAARDRVRRRAARPSEGQTPGV